MEETVHILIGGDVLCGFSDERPGDWPEGNIWAGIEDLAKVNCPTCKEVGGRYLRSQNND